MFALAATIDEEVSVIKDLILSDVSVIPIPEEKLSVIKSSEVKASSANNSVKELTVIPEAEKALEKFNDVV